MPLIKGKSKKTQSKNIKELMKTKPSKKRAKAIDTIAKKEGISKKKAEQKQSVAISYSIKRKATKNATKKKDSISSKQIKMGTTHELEHTKSRKVARKIAMDHLKEHPDYYTVLNKAEKKMKKPAGKKNGK